MKSKETVVTDSIVFLKGQLKALLLFVFYFLYCVNCTIVAAKCQQRKEIKIYYCPQKGNLVSWW